MASRNNIASTDPGDLFELAPDAQLLVDPFADRVLAANAAARDLLACNEQQVCEITPSTLHGEVMAGLVVFTQAVLEQGRGWTDGLSCKALDGRLFTAECHAVRVDTEAGKHMLVTLKDNAQKEAREEAAHTNEFVRRGLTEWRRVEKLFVDTERRTQLILQAAGEGIYGVNAEGLTTFVNPAAERMLGYSAEELIGQNMHTLSHHTYADGSHYPVSQCPIYAAFKDGVVHKEATEVFWRKDGSAFPVEYTSTPIREQDELVGAVVVFRDISERKEAEEKLSQALDELEHLKLKLEQENAYLQEEIREEYNHHEIVGRSKALRQTINKIDMVAPTDAAVMITGESGTGKELIAHAIHQSSDRCDRPLIRVNCAAIPHELFESEFFGHVKGAFTGAIRDRAGRFELADGGTLFLDEVGEIPLQLQSKLLRVLQEGQFERVGSDQTLNVDVRIIAATNRNLEAEAAAGRFREDLFFRLNVFPIPSVALRERREDIPLLASHFLASACRRFNREQLRLSQADVIRLQAYDWPGNVRELENVLERAVIISNNGQLRLELPETKASIQAEKPVKQTQTKPRLMNKQERRQHDREIIERALQECGGKVFGPHGAAELLGIKSTTLASRIKRWGIKYRPSDNTVRGQS